MSDKSSEDLGDEDYCRVEAPEEGGTSTDQAESSLERQVEQEEEEDRKVIEQNFGEISLNQDDEDYYDHRPRTNFC